MAQIILNSNGQSLVRKGLVVIIQEVLVIIPNFKVGWVICRNLKRRTRQ